MTRMFLFLHEIAKRKSLCNYKRREAKQLCPVVAPSLLVLKKKEACKNTCKLLPYVHIYRYSKRESQYLKAYNELFCIIPQHIRFIFHLILIVTMKLNISYGMN